MTACTCDWDPEFHRDLNARRGHTDAGDRCTNTVDPEGFTAGQTPPICTPCVFGCPPEDGVL